VGSVSDRVEAKLDSVGVPNPAFRAFATVDEAAARLRAQEVGATETGGRRLRVRRQSAALPQGLATLISVAGPS
jgi:hypothetical protein